MNQVDDESFIEKLKGLFITLLVVGVCGIILAGLTKGCSGTPLTPEEEIDMKREQQWR